MDSLATILSEHGPDIITKTLKHYADKHNWPPDEFGGDLAQEALAWWVSRSGQGAEECASQIAHAIQNDARFGSALPHDLRGGWIEQAIAPILTAFAAAQQPKQFVVQQQREQIERLQQTILELQEGRPENAQQPKPGGFDDAADLLAENRGGDRPGHEDEPYATDAEQDAFNTGFDFAWCLAEEQIRAAATGAPDAQPE